MPTQSKTRWAQERCRPRSKQQVGFEKEDQDLVSALAASKHGSCSRCAKRRLGIRDRGRPLPSSRPLVHSPCDHTARSHLADGEGGKIPCVGFYGDRICGTSRSDQEGCSNERPATLNGVWGAFVFSPAVPRARSLPVVLPLSPSSLDDIPFQQPPFSLAVAW